MSGRKYEDVEILLYWVITGDMFTEMQAGQLLLERCLVSGKKI